MKSLKIIGSFLVVIITVFGLMKYSSQPISESLSSVAQSNAYQGTTTDATFLNTAKVIKSTSGDVGNVNITTVGTGVLTLYDATTTNINLRVSTKATSTLILARFGVTTALGSYAIDRNFYDGLIVEFIGSLVASSTITSR